MDSGQGDTGSAPGLGGQGDTSSAPGLGGQGDTGSAPGLGGQSGQPAQQWVGAGPSLSIIYYYIP